MSDLEQQIADARAKLAQLEAQKVAGGNSIGSVLKFYRILNGAGRKELSDRVGISPSAIYHIERGKDNVRLSTLFKIAEGLSLKASEIVAEWERRNGKEGDQ